MKPFDFICVFTCGLVVGAVLATVWAEPEPMPEWLQNELIQVEVDWSGAYEVTPELKKELKEVEVTPEAKEKWKPKWLPPKKKKRRAIPEPDLWPVFKEYPQLV